MHAFVINLEKSTDRRSHMEHLLKTQFSLTYEFVSAVDGRKLSDSEKKSVFDVEKSERYYAKRILPGEIGCTLSHQKCYKKLLQSDKHNFVLILEDDILLKNDLLSSCALIENYIDSSIPTVILLSGWYWFFGRKKISDYYSLASVYNAFLTQSYVINKAAAKLLIEERPFIRADDWRYIKKKGVRLLGLSPHIVNQDWSGTLPSTLYAENPYFKGHFFVKARIYLQAIIMKVLKLIRHFEAAE